MDESIKLWSFELLPQIMTKTQHSYHACQMRSTLGMLIIAFFISRCGMFTTLQSAIHGDSPCRRHRRITQSFFICFRAGDISLPVLAGADVVSYFSMEEGAKPVIATGEIRSTHDGYLYFFNSVNHREAFNVSAPHFADRVKLLVTARRSPNGGRTS